MRHELKYVISPVVYHLLRGRISPFMERDCHAGEDGLYFIRSIYFDSMDYRSLEEKINGIDSRKKYRLRFYDGNAEECYLECKRKKGTRIEKTSMAVSEEETAELLTGSVKVPEILPPDPYGKLLVLEKKEGYGPVIVVDYLREAYVYPACNLRITFDQEIAAGKTDDCLVHRRFLPNVLPAGYMVLEVKYDTYLPQHISAILSSVRPVPEAASKYVMCIEKKRKGQIL